jgi:GTP-binding protein Era
VKSGFVNIIGNPNVGKSTLMNRLVGERISIITSKAQTTRHRIMGIVNGADFQIVYSDTPGILRPGYRLQESMMRSVRGAVQDADVILYVTDVVESGLGERNAEIVESVRASGIPTILIINKIDLSTPESVTEIVNRWQQILPDAQVVTASALLGFNTDGLLGRVLELLPEGDPYYDRDALTDRSLRFFASEIIREKILLNYSKEVPYSVEVGIEEYREEPTIDRIRAVIWVSRASQKGILIGHKGEKLKKVGTAARKDLEDFLGKKVFLELFVKVSDGWRDSDTALRRFGYEE